MAIDSQTPLNLQAMTGVQAFTVVVGVVLAVFLLAVLLFLLTTWLRLR